ncbi:alkaline phosphatase [Anaerosalibacter massiliensis]|uniref:Alkaline phosphatase n=1 Tax=Anaerosalibacter massiliensis TaxID=1347392 RepID=A0A9X2MGM6_9FIRM|nr:alkaline phosphatase [Anaerosalibacter massiliensis]MCR2043668.1 alkaline phosphatase [Anaerosalibacter massiliensis]
MNFFKKKRFNLVLTTLLVLSLFLAIYIPSFAQPSRVKNVILLIGDGMGTEQVNLGRIHKGDSLYMDEFDYTGTASTYSADPGNKWVTDSAAAGTALATGVKTYAGAISVDLNQKPIETILEKAQKNKKSTGIVTTTRVTHATPACFASHNINRGNETEIAVDIIENKVDVILGGGKVNFIDKKDGGKRKDGRNLIEEAKNIGYKYIETKNDLKNINDGKILGLFNNSHINYKLDRNSSVEPNLEEMTNKAIDILSKNNKGFFLMVEGGRIDHAAHGNDPGTMVNEVLDFDEAVKAAYEFAKKDKQTLVIVTADHETGGLSIGANDKYEYYPEVLKGQRKSIEYLSEIITISNYKAVIKDELGINDLTKKEESEITLALENKNKRDIFEILTNIMNTRSNTGWTSLAHTGVDVPVKAYGPNAELFSKHLDNTDINKLAILSMKLK